MSKERFLTVLVPIKDSDCEATVYASLAALQSAVPASASNINKIYKIESGAYYRSSFVGEDTYSYIAVIDREFPYLGDPMEIYNFTYDATRMGTAPTISAQGVMRYAEKDNGEDVTLDGLWSQKCHVKFNGENFYLKQIPTSSKSNEDARYKYDLDFVSERVILETVYFYDVIQPFVSEKPISESSTFSFYGDINELAKRINASLIRSNIASLVRKYVPYPTNPSKTVPYLSYEQWNMMNVNPSELIGSGKPFLNAGEMQAFGQTIYSALNADYNAYLMQYIYENDNGKYAINGYQCVIGKDKEGKDASSEEKMIQFEGNTIYEALQQVKDTFELEYYITREKDERGMYTGNTLIVVADCEYDFADIEYVILTSQPSDWETNYYNYYKLVGGEYVALDTAETFVANTYYKKDYTRDNDGIPTTEAPFDYGVDDELLSKEKTNTTDKIVTRITGVGSSENIPWYYPNPNPDGWLRPVMKKNDVEQSSVEIAYPTSEGSTVAQAALYEKFLKNRIGNSIKYGKLYSVFYESDYLKSLISTQEPIGGGLSVPAFYFDVYFPDKEYSGTLTNPRITLDLSYGYGSGLMYFKVDLINLVSNTVIDSYQSNLTYQNPTEFQAMCIARDGSAITTLSQNTFYRMRFKFVVNPRPVSRRYDYSGYFYPYTVINYTDYTGNPTTPYTDAQGYYNYFSGKFYAYIGDDFYSYQGLVPEVSWEETIITDEVNARKEHVIKPILAGYGHVTSRGFSYLIPRRKGKQYRDISNERILLCIENQQMNCLTGQPSVGYLDNPVMGWEEWVTTFLSMGIRLYESDGWYIGSKKVQLSDYGLGQPMLNGSAYVADVGDAIEFQRTKYVTPQSALMPEVYIKTDGERRFYDAHDYYDKEHNTLYTGTADPVIGEEQVGTKVRNPIYKKDESDPDSKHYDFENEYIQDLPHEHIENFEDVKPTIKDQKNYIKVNPTEAQFNANKSFFYTYNNGTYTQCSAGSTYNSSTQYYAQLRIDVFEEFAYDLTDNDEIWESNDGGGTQGEYKHPYFFGKLRPLGFNIFDLALQEDMVVSMTTGNCGACNFKIGVDENTKKNPVQVWEYDVYGGDTFADKGAKLFSAWELRRYVNASNLHYDTNGQQSGYIFVDAGYDIVSGTVPLDNSASSVPMFPSYTYSAEYVANGWVGSAKQGGNVHFEGDVVTNGRFLESMQDTSENSVWVALMKDTDTYGTLMPSARPNYTDSAFDVYIRPSSVSDVHTEESTLKQDDDNADKFVLLNIRLPQMYLRRAERELSRELVAYMYDNNYQKFNFSIKFSRIYIAENESTDDNLNENSVLYVKFNGRVYRQYVKHYTYKMSESESLPEINVEMNQELSVSKTVIQKWGERNKKDIYKVHTQIGTVVQQVQDRISEKTSVLKDTIATTIVEVNKETIYKKIEWEEF